MEGPFTGTERRRASAGSVTMDYFCCYHDYREKLAKLSDQELGRLFRALLDYSATGEAQQLAGREDIAFDFIAADIDKGKKEAQSVQSRNRENGRKGGRPKKPAGSLENHPVFPETQKTDRFLKEEKEEKKKKQKEKKEKEETLPPVVPDGGDGESLVQANSGGLADSDNDFQRFWQAYPRKAGKGAARKAWGKLRPDGELTEAILAAVERDKRTDQWQRDEGRFVPYPATWLNQCRWEDEPEDGGNRAKEPDFGQPASYYDYPRPEDDAPVLFDETMSLEDLRW